jgi:hypothetical protein
MLLRVLHILRKDNPQCEGIVLFPPTRCLPSYLLHRYQVVIPIATDNHTAVFPPALMKLRHPLGRSPPVQSSREDQLSAPIAANNEQSVPHAA